MSNRKKLGHRRQFSDSLTIPSRYLEEVEEVEQDMIDHESLKRTYSDSKLDMPPTKPEIRSISFQEQSPTSFENSFDRQRSQTDPTGHNADAIITVTDIETLKRDMPKEVSSSNTDRLLLAVQSEEEDFLSKLRGLCSYYGYRCRACLCILMLL